MRSRALHLLPWLSLLTVGCVSHASAQTAQAPVYMNATVQSITISRPVLQLHGVGNQAELDVIATINGKAGIGIQNQSLIFTSGNPAVASVNPKGVVTATGLGSTTIYASYVANSTVTSSAAVQVVAAIPGDFNGDNRVDSDDLTILISADGATASGPSDPRDLNHDGKIDQWDQKLEATLCSFPKCSTHP